MQKYSQKDKLKFDMIFGNKSKASSIEKKYLQKTKKCIKYIKWIPGIRMVGVGNSLSMNSAKESSDIDLLIVTEEKRMWLVRIMTTLIFQVIGVRKNEKKHAGKMCLSFFCTRNGLDFSKFSLEKDPYLYFWVLYFKPLLDYNYTYELFLEKNSTWCNLEEYTNIIEENKKYVIYKKNKTIQSNLYTKVMTSIDSLFKNIFLPKTIKSFKKYESLSE